VAVGAFLDRRVEFYQITDSVSCVLDKLSKAKNAQTLEQILEYDKEARDLTRDVLKL
jgi:1-deoxy-D-xylulose 5-phosphate reductoisomerase